MTKNNCPVAPVLRFSLAGTQELMWRALKLRRIEEILERGVSSCPTV